MDQDHVIAALAIESIAGPLEIEGLINAEEMARGNKYFLRPDSRRVRHVAPGSFVKLCRNGERFWVRVTGFVGRQIHGVVSNHLIRNEDVRIGHTIFFYKKNIYDIVNK